MAEYTFDLHDLEKRWQYVEHPAYSTIHVMIRAVYLPVKINTGDKITITNQYNQFFGEYAIPTFMTAIHPAIGPAIYSEVNVPDYNNDNLHWECSHDNPGRGWGHSSYLMYKTYGNDRIFLFGGGGNLDITRIKNNSFVVMPYAPTFFDKDNHWISAIDYPNGVGDDWGLVCNDEEPTTVAQFFVNNLAPNAYDPCSAYATGSVSINVGLEGYYLKPHSDTLILHAIDLGELPKGDLPNPPDPKDPNPGDGDSHGGGGGGTNDLGGDTIEDTGVPTIEATDSGLMTLYNPTVGELQALGRFLWSDGLDLNTFKKLFNDPFDTLLGLSIIPIVPPTSGTKKIMFGNLDSGVSAKVISHQFVPDVDMGTVTLGEVYNGALDYSPFTTVSIYLPFIGYRELNVQDIMNSKIHLVYKFDVLTGGCIAELYVDHLKTGNKSKDNSKFKWGAHSGLLASFEGQCAVNIPLASQDYTNTIRAMIGAVGMVGGAAASFATGNPALGVAALAVGSANSTIQASTPTVQRSGHLSSSNAIMANLTPFLTVTRPHQCKPSKYYKLRGVPSQIYVSKLSSLVTSKHDYYLQVAEIPDIKVAGATDTEIAEIKNLLKEGVVL